MSGWLIAAIIVGVFVLIGMIPVGVDVQYLDDEAKVLLKIGPARVQVLPAKPKKQRARKPKKKAAGKAAEKTAQAAPSQQADAAGAQKEASQIAAKKKFAMPKLTLSDILALVDLACDTLGDLRRKIRVEELMLHVTLDGSDPAKAAMLYGRSWAVLGAMTPQLERLFVIKKRDIQPVLDYNEKEMKVQARLVLTITIGRTLALGLRAGARFLKLWIEKKKAVQTNESSSV